MLKFTTLRWKNFLSTGNYWSEIKLDSAQNTLVIGENGAGKSTMLDALCFALYNKPFRNINKGSLLNSINQKDALVEVAFTTENNNYKIIRGIKPNVFEIYKNGQLLNQDAEARDYQEHLEKFILKLNYKSFTQIVILGSASFTPFMQLSSADRRAIIEDLLDIQIFSLMNALAKDKLSTLYESKTENKILIDAALDKINMQERWMKDVQKDNEKLIAEYEREKAHHTEEIARLNMENAIAMRAIRDAFVKITDKNKVTAAIKKITQLEAQIENVAAKHRKTVQFFESNDSCPTCSQQISEEFKAPKLTHLTGKITECTEGLAQLEQKFKQHQERLTEIEAIEEEIAIQEKSVLSNETSIVQLEKFNVKLDEKIAALQGTHHTTEREQERLQEHIKSLNELEEKKKDILGQTEYYEVASTLLKDTGIKTKIIRQYLPIINMLVNKFLANMDFFVNFTLDETFKETIKSRHRDEFTYPSFSEGEKQRIDMALMLTWRAVAKLKNSANTNLLILDEIFDSSLDNTGAEELMKILQTLDGVNVFVISHRGDILQDKFSSVVRFIKQQNFSRITT